MQHELLRAEEGLERAERTHGDNLVDAEGRRRARPDAEEKARDHERDKGKRDDSTCAPEVEPLVHRASPPFELPADNATRTLIPRSVPPANVR